MLNAHSSQLQLYSTGLYNANKSCIELFLKINWTKNRNWFVWNNMTKIIWDSHLFVKIEPFFLARVFSDFRQQWQFLGLSLLPRVRKFIKLIIYKITFIKLIIHIIENGIFNPSIVMTFLANFLVQVFIVILFTELMVLCRNDESPEYVEVNDCGKHLLIDLVGFTFGSSQSATRILENIPFWFAPAESKSEWTTGSICRYKKQILSIKTKNNL